MNPEQRRGLPWALGGALGVASFVVPWKMASVYDAPEVNTLVLLASAATFSTLLTLAQQRSLPLPSRFDLRVALGLAILTLAGNLASAEAIARISPALLTVMQRGEVILVALIAWPVIGERVDRRFWLAVAIAVAGLVVLYDPFAPAVESGTAETRATGLGWAVASTTCFASMAVMTRRVIHRIDPVAVNGLRLWISVAMWFVFHGVPPELRAVEAPQFVYAAMAGFFGPFAGRLCMMHAARYLEARIVTLALLAAPPLTLVLAFLVLGDLPTAREIVGGSLILLGVAVPVLGFARRLPGSA